MPKKEIKRELYLTTLIKKFRIPPTIDAEKGLYNLTEDDSFFCWLIIKAMEESFGRGYDEKILQCGLYELCRRARHPAFDAGICANMPWKHANDDDNKLCLYGLYWKNFGLGNKCLVKE